MKDPNDISLWKMMQGSNVLAQVLKCLPQIRSKKVIHHSLNGAPYLQQIGVGSTILDLTVFVDDQSSVLMIDKINAEGGIMSVRYKNVLYHGYIEDEMPEWESPVNDGDNYVGTMTFVVIQSIPDRE